MVSDGFFSRVDDIDVAPDKVRAKLASLRPNSSSGPDNIHPRVFRESPDSLSVPLSILFRKSIDAGRLPADWKVGEVVPIYKKGDRQRPASYRPVSLTAVPSKVLESIVRDNWQGQGNFSTFAPPVCGMTLPK